MAQAATRKGQTKRIRKPQKPKAGFEIDGKFYPAGDSYTIDEAINLCDIAGVDNIVEFDLLPLADPRAMKALVWLVKHREDEDFTPEDAGKIKFWNVDPIRPEPEPEQPVEGDGGPPDGSSPEPAPGDGRSSSSPKKSESDSD